MIYRFGRFSLDTARRELCSGETLIQVEPQVFDLLAYVVEARDRVVSRDDLLQAVWQGRIVSEATLSSRLNAARAAIGDTGAAQRLIRTLPRKGVRFVGAVEVALDDPPSASATDSDIGAWRGAPYAPAIAVLPFANLSGNPSRTTSQTA